MPALSQQFNFVINTGTFTATSVAIPSQAVAPNGSTLFLSESLKGDGYWGSPDGLHTVSYTVTPNFVGTITMQASLATAPVDTDWFTVSGTRHEYDTVINPVVTTSSYYANFTGNFVWVRARVHRSSDQPNGSLEFINYNR